MSRACLAIYLTPRKITCYSSLVGNLCARSGATASRTSRPRPANEDCGFSGLLRKVEDAKLVAEGRGHPQESLMPAVQDDLVQEVGQLGAGGGSPPSVVGQYVLVATFVIVEALSTVRSASRARDLNYSAVQSGRWAQRLRV